MSAERTLPRHTVTEDDPSNPRYLSVSSHDWACVCKRPLTVHRFNLQDTGPPVGPTMYKRGFLLPRGTHWDSRNKLVQDNNEGHSVVNNSDRTRSKYRVEDLMKGLIPMRNTHQVDRQLVENRKRREFDRILSCKPVSVKGAFRISVPHWQHRKHTQQWAWDNKVQSQLWSSRDSYLKVADPGVHVSQLRCATAR